MDLNEIKNTTTRFDKFLINNIAVLKINNDGQYIYSYEPSRYCDMISDIKLESKPAKMHYLIGGVRYEPEDIDEFLFISSRYHVFEIFITFSEKPCNDDIFRIKYKAHDFNYEHRKILASTDIIAYKNGMCLKKCV